MLLQKIAELTKKLEQGTEEEKKAVLQDIERLKEVQKQKEENFAKEIENLGTEKESKKIEEPSKVPEQPSDIQGTPILEPKSSSNKIERIETKPPEPENIPKEAEGVREAPKISENVPSTIETPKSNIEAIPKLKKEIYELS